MRAEEKRHTPALYAVIACAITLELPFIMAAKTMIFKKAEGSGVGIFAMVLYLFVFLSGMIPS